MSNSSAMQATSHKPSVSSDYCCGVCGVASADGLVKSNVGDFDATNTIDDVAAVNDDPVVVSLHERLLALATAAEKAIPQPQLKEIFDPGQELQEPMFRLDKIVGANGFCNSDTIETERSADFEKTKMESEDHSADPSLNEATWKWHYENLVQYHAIHGDSNVLRSDSNKRLSGWVKRQRDNLKDGRLSPYKILLLNKLHFVWNRNDAKWCKKFNRLVRFQKRFRHCYVNDKFDRSLAEWAQRQRREYKDGKISMTDARVKKLEALQGWSWKKQR